MDSTDEEFYGSTSFTTKGRRTKRQRTTTTSSYGGGNGGGAYLDNSYGSSASATPSLSTPDDHDIVSEVTTEEQDMANCLILLAQGLQKRRSSKANNNSHNNNNTSTSVVIGVYECKTCNRTFPSFQALGGHRTSHKKIIKPPSTTAPNTTQPPKSVHQHRDNATEGGSQDSSPVPLPRENTRKSVANRNSDKVTTRVHECSICGSEFPSGQALGGHMRRHRPAVTPHDRPMIGDVSTSTAVIDLGGASRNILSLDLNLPAPNDDHDQVIVDDSSHMVETKFHVLPTPALLDCHY